VAEDETERSLRVVREVYQAVGRSDIAAILARMAPTARWEFNAAERDVPWYAPATGPAQIEALLTTFGGSADIHAFEPVRFVAQGSDVFVEVHLAYTVKRTNRRVDETQLNWWSLSDGLITRLRHFEDTAQVVAAWSPAEA
jgi:ketosteroid isomerase-like protein